MEKAEGKEMTLIPEATIGPAVSCGSWKAGAGRGVLRPEWGVGRSAPRRVGKIRWSLCKWRDAARGAILPTIATAVVGKGVVHCVPQQTRSSAFAHHTRGTELGYVQSILGVKHVVVQNFS